MIAIGTRKWCKASWESWEDALPCTIVGAHSDIDEEIDIEYDIRFDDGTVGMATICELYTCDRERNLP